MLDKSAGTAVLELALALRSLGKVPGIVAPANPLWVVGTGAPSLEPVPLKALAVAERFDGVKDSFRRFATRSSTG
jgi:hypothetical protein